MKHYRYHDIQAHIKRYELLSPLDVLLVGATGTGKSSTVNALFNVAIAKVGHGVAPETQIISAYSLHNYFRFHDSAGLGDGKNNDLTHSKNITYELRKICGNCNNNLFMDLVMVLLDGSSRDLGTPFRLLESVVLKSIEPKRVIVAINQADRAMKGRYWDSRLNQPESCLIDFLNEQSLSVKQRINRLVPGDLC